MLFNQYKKWKKKVFLGNNLLQYWYYIVISSNTFRIVFLLGPGFVCHKQVHGQADKGCNWISRAPFESQKSCPFLLIEADQLPLCWDKPGSAAASPAQSYPKWHGWEVLNDQWLFSLWEGKYQRLGDLRTGMWGWLRTWSNFWTPQDGLNTGNTASWCCLWKWWI